MCLTSWHLQKYSSLLSLYSSLIISNIESFFWNEHLPVICCVSRKPAPKKCRDQIIRTLFLLWSCPISWHTVGLHGSSKARTFPGHSPAQNEVPKYSSIGMTDSSPSEWETTGINGELHLHTHTYTRANMNKLFMKKPTYFHASQSGSSQTVFLFPLFQVPWFIFLTNHFPNYKLLFIKWSSAQMMSVLISWRLDHHTKGNCTCHWGRPWPPGASFSLDQRSLKLWPQGWMVLGWLKCITFIVHFISIIIPWGLPGDSDSKKPACNAGDRGLIPGSGISPGEGNGNPLQCSCLESSMDRGALQATVHGVEKSRTLLSN